MRKRLTSTLLSVLGRRLAWRAGRALYMGARREAEGSALGKNGEIDVMVQAIRRIAAQDQMTFIDVGANVGDWTVALAKNLAEISPSVDARVYAFEPTEGTRQTLTRRIAEEKTSVYIEVVPFGASSSTGQAYFFVGGDNAGTNSIHLSEQSGAKRTVIQLVTLDEFCANVGVDYIDYLKIDAEGHDFDVLKGARGLFNAERIECCQFEYNNTWIYSRHFLRDVYEFIADLNYLVGKIVPGGIEFYPTYHPELERFFAANFLIVKASIAHDFQSVRMTFNHSNTADSSSPSTV